MFFTVLLEIKIETYWVVRTGTKGRVARERFSLECSLPWHLQFLARKAVGHFLLLLLSPNVLFWERPRGWAGLVSVLSFATNSFVQILTSEIFPISSHGLDDELCALWRPGSLSRFQQKYCSLCWQPISIYWVSRTESQKPLLGQSWGQGPLLQGQAAWPYSSYFASMKVKVCTFIYLFLKDFIYLFTRDTHRDAETQAEGEAGSLRGARCGTWSQDPGPKADTQPLSHPGVPWKIDSHVQMAKQKQKHPRTYMHICRKTWGRGE